LACAVTGLSGGGFFCFLFCLEFLPLEAMFDEGYSLAFIHLLLLLQLD